MKNVMLGWTAAVMIMLVTLTNAATGTIFISPDGNDRNNGKDGPVKSLHIAILKAANNGDGSDEVIEMAAGTYDAVSLNSELSAYPRNWTKNLVIQGAPGAVVIIKGLTVDLPRLTFKHVRVDGDLTIWKNADYCRLEQVVGIGAGYWTCAGADNVVWYRCFNTDPHAEIKDRIRFGSDADDEVPVNMLVEECYFRGSDVSGEDGNHIDNIQIIGADGLTFKNCVIWNAPTGVVMTGPVARTSYIRNITWDGCYIGDGEFYGSADVYDNITIKNCLINGGCRYGKVAGSKGDRWENNRILFWSQGSDWPSSFSGNTIKVTGWAPTKPNTREVPDGNTKDPDLVLERPAVPEPQLNTGAAAIMAVGMYVPGMTRLPSPVSAAQLNQYLGMHHSAMVFTVDGLPSAAPSAAAKYLVTVNGLHGFTYDVVTVAP